MDIWFVSTVKRLPGQKLFELFESASTDDRYRRRPALHARTDPALEASLRVRSEVNMTELPKPETKNETENVSGDRHLDSEELAAVIRRYSSSSPEDLTAVTQRYFSHSPKDGLNFVRACLTRALRSEQKLRGRESNLSSSRRSDRFHRYF